MLAAIDRLAPQGATSLGQGIFTSLNAIAGEPITPRPEAPLEGDIDDIDIGYFGSAAVVLLSDGENTSEPGPARRGRAGRGGGREASTRSASAAPSGTVVEIDGFSVATALDEELLNEIASVTDGQYFHAEDAESLGEIYDHDRPAADVRRPRRRRSPALVTGISVRPAARRRRAVARCGSGRLV